MGIYVLKVTLLSRRRETVVICSAQGEGEPLHREHGHLRAQGKCHQGAAAGALPHLPRLWLRHHPRRQGPGLQDPGGFLFDIRFLRAIPDELVSPCKT